MTGLATRDNYIFLGSRNQNRAYRYTMPSINNRAQNVYFNGYSQTRDIAVTPDSIMWVASDWADIPVKAFNRSGVLVNTIESTLTSHARGVAFDPEGYVWVSNMVTDEIYKIDVTAGIEGSDPETSTVLSVSTNPFQSSVVITANGFAGTSSIAIYDINGHIVVQDSFENSYTWNGSSSLTDASVPSGAYFAVVSDGQGNTASVQLVRL